ncbi:kunitz-type protease inhibitor 2 [Pristis pectinata]|uniref:kunitz-type protease inhibitor 2 n=1 Tax=Pristis pectinata TaxID=685728 RepID=UPI00223CD7AA|nr:kunitz-type protease inhibitor 2 [Pristis pectinata]
MALLRFTRCTLFLAGLSAISGVPADPLPTKECLGSYNTSQGFTLHPESWEKGAELLDVRRVNSSSVCLSRCCALARCNLALIQESGPGGLSCLLVNCFHDQKPVCTLLSSQGYQASLKSDSALKKATLAVDCTSPSKTGPCRAAFPKWYYNTTEQTCQEFVYGGCLANLNNYDSKEACMKTCNKATGPSNNFVPMVGRSVVSLKECSKQCSADEFLCADGCCVSLDQICDGTAHCPDESDLPYCNAVRISYILLTESEGLSNQDNERCTAPKVVGNCRAAFPRWYFDPKTQTCNPFIYGGCNGNQNNYQSELECLTTCAGQTVVVAKSQAHRVANAEDKEYCFAPAVTGKCRASFPRWYYDPVSQTCQRFTYGGCRGNKNNYKSEETCLARCSGRTVADNWDDNEDGSNHEKQHQTEFRRHVSAISMVVLLAVCILILLGGVIYFIVKLAKADHVVSYHRTRSGDDKETLINTV